MKLVAPHARRAVLFAVLAGACDRTRPEPPPAAAAAPAPAKVALSPRISRPAVDRIVAIGDLHGDLAATRGALRLAGAIDESDKWIGGNLVVVQTGDELDRGDDDRAILDLTERLIGEAAAAGGAFVALSGNHELMNVAFDFRYVTPAAFKPFADMTPDANAAARFASIAEQQRGRAVAFAPGGVYARMLAKRPIVMKIGDNVFVHGGVLPKHLAYGLDRMNDEVAAWMRGEAKQPPTVVVSEDGPVWTRAYSLTPNPEDCAALDQVLAQLEANRMIVGHTVQQSGISTACNQKVFRIDVGLAKVYGGPRQVLEITKDGARVKKE